jgi:hypothetical protein
MPRRSAVERDLDHVVGRLGPRRGRRHLDDGVVGGRGRAAAVTFSGWRSTSSARARLGRRRMKPRSSSAEISRCTPDLL